MLKMKQMKEKEKVKIYMQFIGFIIKEAGTFLNFITKRKKSLENSTTIVFGRSEQTKISLQNERSKDLKGFVV
jgi:hypothetical protein